MKMKIIGMDKAKGTDREATIIYINLANKTK